MQQCYGYGALSGKVALGGNLTASNVAAGIYPVSIICGGTETGFVKLTVGNTQVAASSSSSSITSGQSVGLSAAVANDGNPVPTGTVQFVSGSTVLGSTALGAGALPGQAYFYASTAGVAPGTYSVVAKYLGDGNYAPASSAPFNVTVTPKIATTLALTPATQTLVEGQTASFTATLGSSGAYGNYPTGTINLLNGSTVVATANQSSPDLTSLTLSPVTSGIPAGTYTLTAQYLGSPYYLGSTSPPVTIKIVNGDTVTVAANPNPVPKGEGFTLTATLTGKPLPTGTVVFNAGAQDVGSATVSGSGVATVTVAAGTLASGNYQLTAYYAGDSNNVPITSSAITLTVQ
jgi:hypothetical protein